VILSAEAGQTIAMVLHELVTNAAKYGALSTPLCQVAVRWHRWPERRYPNRCAEEKLILQWQESGGPRVSLPIKPSYGTSVIRDLIPYELEGTVELRFLAEGVQCRIEIPLNRLGNGAD